MTLLTTKAETVQCSAAKVDRGSRKRQEERMAAEPCSGIPRKREKMSCDWLITALPLSLLQSGLGDWGFSSVLPGDRVPRSDFSGPDVGAMGFRSMQSRSRRWYDNQTTIFSISTREDSFHSLSCRHQHVSSAEHASFLQFRIYADSTSLKLRHPHHP